MSGSEDKMAVKRKKGAPGVRPHRVLKYAGIALLLFTAVLFSPYLSRSDSPIVPAGNRPGVNFVSPERPKNLTLEQCIELALMNNRMRKVSKASREMAEAQYQQALSAYWPQLNVTSTGTRMENAPLFIFPGQPLPLGNAAGSFADAIAAGQLAKMGIAPGTPQFQALFPQARAQALQGLQTTTLPDQTVKLMDRDTLVTSLELAYPLFTGGKRSAIKDQAKAGVEIAKEESRRTDLQVVSDVKRYYYGSILARSLLKAGENTLEGLQFTLELTENLYKHGSGKVKKTDYLRTKVMTASIRSVVELLRSNEKLARAALVNTMGLDWQTEVEAADREIPFQAFDKELEKLVIEAHRWNPRLVQVRLGIGATEAGVREARSGHLPVVVAFGNVNRIDNAYNAGIMADDNKRNWTLGFRVEIPLFNGFRTTNKEKEAIARVEKIRQEDLLLKEGIALQVKDAFLQVMRAQAQVRATKDAFSSAVENRELNVRAYQDELVETKDVIEAQIMEFFINGQYLRAVYDSAASQCDLEIAVGKGLNGTGPEQG